MTWLLQDLRFGFRSIGKDRSFFLTSVLALALGIGAATIIFSIIDNILLNPFPYFDSHRIYDIEIQDRTSRAAAGRNSFSVPEFLDLQQQNRAFDRTIGVWEVTTLLGNPSAPASLDTDVVTGNAFQFLGVPALLGRGIQPQDAQPGAQPVFVLSYKVWVKRFALDPSILGKRFLLNNTPTTLIGIMPPRFAFWGGDIWMPAVLDRARSGLAQPGKDRYVLYGHLKPGLNPKAAESNVKAVLNHLAQVYPELYPSNFGVSIESLGEQTIGHFKPTLFLLLGAVGLILLIACANVANLLLARATTREREFALRRALGASRFRLIAQLLIESMLLALSGALAGCAVASVGLQGLVAILPIFTFPDEAVIGLNYQVLAATIVTAMFAALVFGLVPALTASRRQAQESMAGGSRGNTSFRQGRLRNAFIVSQIALSLTLLTSAGLLMRTFFAQRGVDLGVRTDHLLVSNLALPAAAYGTPGAPARFVRTLLPHLASIPGVLSVAAASELPPHGGVLTDFELAGIQHSSKWRGFYSACTSGYFETVGLRLLSGRLPTAADEEGKRRVAVINRTMASQYFGRLNPVGRQLQLAALNTDRNAGANAWLEIVGVVSDTKNNGLREPVLPAAYVPYTIAGFSNFNLYLHTVGNPAAVASALTKQVLSMDRNVVPQQTLTMDDLLEIGEYARPRFGVILISTFASVGLILVIVGVYSVASYSVAQRQREIGIRMALGARPLDIRKLVLRAGLSVMLLGVGAGMCLTSFATRLLASQVWGISVYDPVTLGTVVVILTSVGLFASYLPSRRAAQVDPVVCLRSE